MEGGAWAGGPTLIWSEMVVETHKFYLDQTPTWTGATNSYLNYEITTGP
jgi:hypothetical protein